MNNKLNNKSREIDLNQENNENKELISNKNDIKQIQTEMKNQNIERNKKNEIKKNK